MESSLTLIVILGFYHWYKVICCEPHE